MKIIIAGAGAVGTHLAKLLSKEEQDIILMDAQVEVLNKMSTNFDLMTIHATSTSIKGLKEAGVSNADLFIAVTPDESRNITSAILATKLGAKKTVARVDNHEYLEPENTEFLKLIGVDSLIYPEKLAAKEIVGSIQRSWARQWWEFSGGELVLIGVKVRESSLILDIPLRELDRTQFPFHIVAIKRRNENFIPQGDDAVQLNDLVFFTTSKKHVNHIKHIAGKDHYKEVKNVMIMGGSRIAVQTVFHAPEDMNIKIIDANLDRCNHLTEILDSRTMVINGDGRDLDLLLEEGIKHTEAFVALTSSSETNILACLAAKRMGVRKTVAEVENIDYINMAESLDIGTVVNKKMITAGHIYQMMLDADVLNVKCLNFVNADVAEFRVSEGAKITRSQVKDLELPRPMTIGGLVRGREGMIVTGDTQILPGDLVIVFCMDYLLKKAERFFN